MDNEQELWDLYDENRTFLDRTHVRGEPMEEGTYHLAISVWVMTSDGKMLITHRDPSKKRFPNMWECTNGSVLADETSHEAACRELLEETGIESKESELIFVHSYRAATAFIDTFLLKKDISLEALELQPGETDDARLITFEQLELLVQNPELFAPAHAEGFQMYHDKLKMLVQMLTDSEAE